MYTLLIWNFPALQDFKCICVLSDCAVESGAELKYWYFLFHKSTWYDWLGVRCLNDEYPEGPHLTKLSFLFCRFWMSSFGDYSSYLLKLYYTWCTGCKKCLVFCHIWQFTSFDKFRVSDLFYANDWGRLNTFLGHFVNPERWHLLSYCKNSWIPPTLRVIWMG